MNIYAFAYASLFDNSLHVKFLKSTSEDQALVDGMKKYLDIDVKPIDFAAVDNITEAIKDQAFDMELLVSAQEVPTKLVR